MFQCNISCDFPPVFNLPNYRIFLGSSISPPYYRGILTCF
nr:MAG TPA: hypothetical protein [Caudoviricetes sp.]